MARSTNYAVKLSLDAASYLRNLARVQTVTAKATSSMARGFKLFTAAFISTAAVRQLGAITQESLSTIRQLDKLSLATGVAAEDLQVFARASEFAGDSELNLQKAIESLQRTRIEAIRGNKTLIRAYEDLGFTQQQLADETTSDLFQQIVVSLQGMENGALRAHAASKIFGGEWEKMSGLIANGREAFAKARQEIAELGAGLDRIDLAAVRIASKSLSDLGDAWQVFKQRVVINLTPVISSMAEAARSKLLDPAFIDAASKALSDFIIMAVRFARTLPDQLGLAWRSAAVEILKVRRLFEGGIAGLKNPVTDGIDQDIAKITAEIQELKATISAANDPQMDQFFVKLKESLKDAGTITAGAVKQISPQMERLKQDLEAVQSTIEDGLTDTLAEFITTGKNGFRELGQTILKELVSALIRAQVVTPLLNMIGLGKGGGGVLGSLFGGFKAAGGPVESGKAYVVGEKRPELFVPSTAGRIVPDASKAGGRMLGGDTYYIDARGADSGAIARLENMILSLNASVERRSVEAVADATRRGRLGFA